MKPLFSIITVCYNSENTIERTIRSILAQSYSDYEYIIVDGSSNDGTLNIIQRFEPLFNGRLKWISEPDKGIYDAMNKGIVHSSGLIIGIVNSDDWLEIDALDIISKCYKDKDPEYNSVCCGWMNFHYDNGICQILKTNKTQLYAMSRKYEMGGIRHPATFVPKTIYENLGFFDISIKIMADTDLILRFVDNNVKFIFSNEILTNMSDGGFSNKGLMKACGDYSIILKKRNVGGLKYFAFYYSWCAKRFIKGILPLKILKKIRDKR